MYALIEGIAAPNREGQGKCCRAAVIDITQRRFLEESLRDAACDAGNPCDGVGQNGGTTSRGGATSHGGRGLPPAPQPVN